MLCKPKPFYDETSKMEISYENPLYLKKVTQVQPTLYDGYAMVKTGHTPALVSNSEETLDLAKKSRQKMLEKVKEGNQNEPKAKLNFGPLDYLKENYLATFVPQKQLTPEQLYWSKDLANIAKEKALEQYGQKPKTALTVYPPNTPTKLVPKFILTKKKEVEQNDVDKRNVEIERKNLLIENENLIAALEHARVVQLKAKISKLKHKIEKDDHNEMIKSFSKLEIDHLDLQLMYNNLKACFKQTNFQPPKDALEFDLLFKITQLEETLQAKDNTIKKLKTYISRLNEQNGQDEKLIELNKRKDQLHNRADEIKELTKQISQLRAQVSQLKGKSSEVDSVVDLKALEPLNIELRDNVFVL
ncbi:hypothetical protein Tco_1533499 [Tanacetum coccineum]